MKSLGIKLLVGVCVFAVGAFAALWAATALSAPDSGTRSSQLIESITREEQVVLLSLGIQGIDQKDEPQSKFFGMFDVPGSERTKFVQYSFKAKLGIEGKDVMIESVGEDKLLVSLPKFIFIGHSSPTFKMVAEKNGVLSWVSPEVDTLEMVNSILDDDAQNQHVEENEAILKDQAKAFYGGIISSIDPTIQIKFDFR